MKQITERTQFGTILRSWRKARKMPVRAIAEATGYSMQAVTNWEIGRFAPDLVTLCKIGDLFQCSLDELVGRTPSEHVQTITVNGGDYNAPVAGRDINGSIGGRGAKQCKDCAAKDRLIASQQATIDRLSKMLEALAAPKK